MNRSQRKYLMEEINRVYDRKKDEVKKKYSKYAVCYEDIISNYIKANKIKLRFKNDKEVIDFLYSAMVEYLNIGYYTRDDRQYRYGEIYDILKDYEIWFDMEDIYKKKDEEEDKKEKVLNELREKYNYICDMIMFETGLKNFIKNEIPEENIDKSIDEYIKDFEEFEI